MRLLWTSFTLTLALAANGQDVAFRAGTRLVEVSVTVLDRDGNAITGLRAEDFRIEDAGKTRPVGLFQFDGGTVAGQANASLPGGVFTNMVEAVGGAPRNVSAIVLDGLNTSPEHDVAARAQVVRYLKALTPETRMAVFHLGRQLRVLHDFIDDADALRRKVEKATLEVPLEIDFTQAVLEAEQYVALFGAVDPALRDDAAAEQRAKLEFEMLANAAIRRHRMERTLAAMESIGDHLSGIPGRKNLVWITGGFSMLAMTGHMGGGPRGEWHNYEAKVRDTSRRLAQRGITLYIVDAAGVAGRQRAVASASSPGAVPLPETDRHFERLEQTDRISNDPVSTMSLMASVTGGHYLYNNNDFLGGFRKAVADLRGSYTLGFYAPEDGDGKWRKLRVRVARPDVKVLHRQGYYAEGLGAPDWNSDIWRAAITSPLGSSAVRFTVACERKTGGELGFQIRVAAGSLRFAGDPGKMKANLQLMIAGRSAAGGLWTDIREASVDLPPEKASKLGVAVIPIALDWKPDPAAEVVRVLLRDKSTGRYGTVDIPLKEITPAAGPVS